MYTYIVLLRGINVGGHKKIKMIDLKQLFVDMGLINVTTFIQSGNIVFESDQKSIPLLETKIAEKILCQFGFEIPVLLLTAKYLQSIFDDNPFLTAIKEGVKEEKMMYFTFLFQVPEIVDRQSLTITLAGNEKYKLCREDKIIYFYAANGYGNTKFTNNFFEKKLKAKATTRNFKTVSKLLDLSNL